MAKPTLPQSPVQKRVCDRITKRLKIRTFHLHTNSRVSSAIRLFSDHLTFQVISFEIELLLIRLTIHRIKYRMRGSCVSSIENRNIWWFDVFSVASGAEVRASSQESGGR
jgi:hypothetical protein